MAKRLIDKGFHPPTIYFPLTVDEAMLIEPTETESLETLDAFAAAMLEIAEEARSDTRARPTGLPTRRRSAVSTRPRPPASRTCAGEPRREPGEPLMTTRRTVTWKGRNGRLECPFP